MVKKLTRLKTIGTPPTSPEIKKIFKSHKEAVVITTNPDNAGETNIAVFTKFSNDNSVLSACLDQILANLLRMKNEKPRNTSKATATSA